MSPPPCNTPALPPPEQTGHTGEDPVSQKKLKVDKEGMWDTHKGILGWIFDGLKHTMELLPQKIEKIHDAITKILCWRYCNTKEFSSIVGKLQHASLGIPVGTSLLALLYAGGVGLHTGWISLQP